MESLKPGSAARSGQIRRRTALAAALASLLASLLAAPHADAQDNPFAGLGTWNGEGVGNSAFPFLRLAPGARALSLGGRELTTGQEAAALLALPAALGTARGMRYSLTHGELLGEFRHEEFSLAWPLDFGSLGFTATGLFSGLLLDARDIDENPAAADAYDLRLGAAYGKAFGSLFAAGLRLDLIRGALADASAHALAFSASSLLRLGPDYRLALALNHLSPGVRYDGPDAPQERLPLHGILELGRPAAHRRLSWHAGLEHGNDGLMRGYAGAEWKALNALWLRGGYEGVSADRELALWSGLSAGFGFSWEALTLDYGIKAMSPLGFHHALSLHYSRKSWTGADKDLLGRSQDQYRQGRYAKALKLCREAAELNPYNYQARAFCQQIERDLLRLSDQAVSLLFTANTQGHLAPVWVDGKPLGGLPRRQSKLKELLASYPRSVALDAGGLHAAEVQEDLAAYVYAAYARMPYHAVNAGTEISRHPQAARKHSLPLVATAGGDAVGATARKELGGRGWKIMVYGLSETRDGGVEGMARRLRSEWKTGAALQVALLQGRLESARRLARAVPQLDAIVLAGEAVTLRQPAQEAKTLIVSPGTRGTHLGQLTFVLDKKGGRRSFTHRLIPLDAGVAQDEDMAKLLGPVVANAGAGLEDPGMDDYHASVLAAVARSRDAGGRLLLLDLEGGGIHPLPHPGLSASSPTLGYGRNRVAFVGADSAGRKEFYLAQPGKPGLDTLTRWGGEAVKARFISKGRALLGLYRREGRGRLVRLDPWNRAASELSENRFGDIRAFAVHPKTERVAFTAGASGAESLWVAALDLSSPLALPAAPCFAGSPAWSPDGKRLAALECARAAEAEGTVALFDLESGKKQPVAASVRARTLAFSDDGKNLLLSTGINLLDVHILSLDSLTLRALPGPLESRSRERPRPKLWKGKDGVLYEHVPAAGGRRSLRFVEDGREIPLLAGEEDYFLE